MKLCTNCKYEDTNMNEWPCNMCNDISYEPSEWEAKDDEPECPFCWGLKAEKEEITGKKKFYVKLVVVTFNDDGEYDETYLVGNLYKLNYCPVCGKEIK